MITIKNKKDAMKLNKAYINKVVNDYSNSLLDDNSKIYLKSCFKQAVEFSEIQDSATLETKPLIQFYSILNLTKVFIIINTQNLNHSVEDFNRMFASHGASSRNDGKIKINSNGTFREFSNLYNYNLDSEFTELELYNSLPDFLEYNDFIEGLSCNYIKAQSCQTYMLKNGLIDANLFFHWMVVKDTDYNSYLKVNDNFKIQSRDRNYIIFSKNDPEEDLDDICTITSDGELVIDTTNNNIDEELIIYLLLLKYSSYVRYQPHLWKQKIESNELMLVELILGNHFKKFWAIISKKLTDATHLLI